MEDVHATKSSGKRVGYLPGGAVPGAGPREGAAQVRTDRLESIDVLRGLVMAVMVLDHARDYFSAAAVSPTDLAAVGPGLFLTRWVTHFCAPVFFLLAGTGAYLYGRRGRPRGDLAYFLLTRGAFLVLLDLTVVRLGWDFNTHYEGGPMFVVLSALGVSMIALAGLIYLPTPWVAGVGAAMILLHNLADGVRPEQLGALAPLWSLLHVRGPAQLGVLPFYVSYPLIPWVGVMALGYGVGPLFERDRAARRRQFLVGGLALTLAFVALRAANVYGDPYPWERHADALTSFLSFLNVTKYPPSLLYLLMTLGPALVALALLDRTPGPFSRALIPLGRTALFFYLLHLYLIHGLALGFGAWQGYEVRALRVFYTELPTGYGFSLPVVYLLWLLVLALLYPVCLWYAKLKQERKKEAWPSYL